VARVGAEYGGGEAVVWTARMIFLSKVEVLAPQVLEALRDDVAPHYLAAWEAPDDRFPTREHWELAPSFFRQDIATLAAEHPDASYSRLAPFNDALRTWSDQFHLADEWCAQVALHTLNDWARSSHPVREPLRFRLPSFGGAVPEDPTPPDFRLPEWSPTFETWAEVEERARAAFENALKQYREAGRAWAGGLGLEAAPTMKAPKDLDLSAHFEWLVRWQVQGWTQPRIANEYKRRFGQDPAWKERDPKSIASALRKTADLIGLTRRSV